MLKVYVVMDDCPAEFDVKKLIKVYLNREDARKYVRNRKGQDPYRFQYYNIIPMTVKTNDKGD